MATVFGTGQVGSRSLELALGSGQLAPPSFDEATIRLSVEAVVALSSYRDWKRECHVFELRGFEGRVKRAEISDQDLAAIKRSDMPNLVADVYRVLVDELVAEVKAEFEAVLAQTVVSRPLVEVLPGDD